MGIEFACLVPHPPLAIPSIGAESIQKIQSTLHAYRQIADTIASLRPDTILLASPHAPMYQDYFHIASGHSAQGDFGAFGHKEIEFHIDYDEEMITQLEALCSKNNFPAGTLGISGEELDHGTMVPLYFIREAYENHHLSMDFKLVKLSLSGESLLNHYQFGKWIQQTMLKFKKRTVFIASGDLSHKLKEDGPYGYAAEGPVYDEQIMTLLQAGAFGKLLEFSEDFLDAAAQCGHRSVTMMAGALADTSVTCEQLSYEGPFGVGYGICTFYPQKKDLTRDYDVQYRNKVLRELPAMTATGEPYIFLAKSALFYYLKTGERLPLSTCLPQEMLSTRAGTFVSLHKSHALRGCIGTIAPVCDSLAEEIIENAISAATKDPRFSRVTASEFDELEFSVDVLQPPESITDSSLLDVKKYGVIVTNGNRRGLLLPNLDGIRSVEQQIAIARQKAGIAPEEEVTLQRFCVTRHNEN